MEAKCVTAKFKAPEEIGLTSPHIAFAESIGVAMRGTKGAMSSHVLSPNF